MGKFYRLSNVEISFVPPVILSARAYGCLKVSASSPFSPFLLKCSAFSFGWSIISHFFGDHLFSGLQPLSFLVYVELFFFYSDRLRKLELQANICFFG